MKSADPAVTLAALQQMKVDRRKIVGVVAWDYQMAQIVDRAGVDLVSVGDTVGVNLWGHTHPLEVTLDEMVIVCKAVRRGVKRALLSCDFPYGPLQEGTATALRAAIRLVKEAGADMIKLDGAADFPDVVEALVRAGIPVFAQFGITPQMQTRLLEEAKRLEGAGAALLDFTNSGPAAGAAVAAAVRIPVIGGFGGGPWLDGRMRLAHGAIGYAASSIDAEVETYANVARIALDAITAYAGDVRAARQIKGAPPMKTAP